MLASRDGDDFEALQVDHACQELLDAMLGGRVVERREPDNKGAVLAPLEGEEGLAERTERGGGLSDFGEDLVEGLGGEFDEAIGFGGERESGSASRDS